MLQTIPKLTLCPVESSPAVSLDKSNLAIQIWPDLHGDVFAHCYTQDDTDWIELPGLAAFAISKNQEEVTAFFHPTFSEELIRETYLRWVLPMVLQASGTEVLHSSAVLMPQGALALCGKSWSGKSTMAYTLSQRGYPLWSDDAVPFETLGEQVFTAYLPFRIQLRPASRSFFGLDSLRSDRTWGGHFRDDRQRRGPTALAAVGILKPMPSDQSVQVEIRSLTQSAAFPGLLSHAYCFSLRDQERKRRMMERYMELSTQVPIFEIRYTRNLERIAEVADGIEAAFNRLCPEMTALVKQS